jgi:hypothetical protein
MDTIKLSPEQLQSIAEKKATCPFLGSAVRRGDLGVRNSAERPLGAIEDIVVLGDSGGGDLGTNVLKLFATGNHSLMPGPSGEFNVPLPLGMMSLDLAGSQGAHPGHSGILLGDPTVLDAGRFSADDFERLAKHADANGRISTEAIGKFIAENLARDPNRKVLPIDRQAADLFGRDGLFARLSSLHTEQGWVKVLEKFTKFAGEDNLIGSSGEFGLMFAFLANHPELRMEGDPGIRLEDIEQMFVHHQFPSGWKTWPKKASDWFHATAKIATAAGLAYAKEAVKKLL